MPIQARELGQLCELLIRADISQLISALNALTLKNDLTAMLIRQLQWPLAPSVFGAIVNVTVRKASQ